MLTLREGELRFFESSAWAFLAAQFDKAPKLFSNCSFLSSTLLYAFTFFKPYVKEACQVTENFVEWRNLFIFLS